MVPKLIPISTYSVGLFGAINGNTLLSETIIGHRAVADAIRDHDPAAAERAMRDHLEQNRVELDAILEELRRTGGEWSGQSILPPLR